MNYWSLKDSCQLWKFMETVVNYGKLKLQYLFTKLPRPGNGSQAGKQWISIFLVLSFWFDPYRESNRVHTRFVADALFTRPLICYKNSLLRASSKLSFLISPTISNLVSQCVTMCIANLWSALGI